MDKPPPRPTHRPSKMDSSIENASDLPNHTHELDLDSDTSDFKHEEDSQPPPRPSSRPSPHPIRIQPADPEPPQFSAKSDLQQKLEQLDTPNAAENPEAIEEFTAISKKLDEEGPGGPTASALHFPALGPRKNLQDLSTIPQRPPSRPTRRPKPNNSSESQQTNETSSIEENGTLDSESNLNTSEESNKEVAMREEISPESISKEKEPTTERSHLLLHNKPEGLYENASSETHQPIGVSSGSSDKPEKSRLEEAEFKKTESKEAEPKETTPKDINSDDIGSKEVDLKNGAEAEANKLEDAEPKETKPETNRPKEVESKEQQDPGVTESKEAETKELKQEDFTLKEGESKKETDSEATQLKEAETKLEDTTPKETEAEETSERKPESTIKDDKIHDPSAISTSEKRVEDDTRTGANDTPPHTLNHTETKENETKDVEKSSDIKTTSLALSKEQAPGEAGSVTDSLVSTTSSSTQDNTNKELADKSLANPASQAKESVETPVEDDGNLVKPNIAENSIKDPKPVAEKEPESAPKEKLDSDTKLEKSVEKPAEDEIDPKDTSSMGPPPRPSKRPEKPIAPKPKSAMALRFEAALRESEESKPAPPLKPKPRLSSGGPGGRVAALQASMFADLNAALSRGPPPGSRPQFGSQSSQSDVGDASSTAGGGKEAGNESKQSAHVDANESADSQISAMPKLPKSRAAGPGRRRRLPESVKPKFTVVTQKNALWEIPATSSARNDSLDQSNDSDTESNHSEKSEPKSMGVRTEVNLRDALVKSLNKSDSSSKNSDSKSGEGTAGPVDGIQGHSEPSIATSTSTIDDNAPVAEEDPLMLKPSELANLGLPSLGSLVDQVLSPAAPTFDDGPTSSTDSVEKLLSSSSSSKVATPSTEMLGVNLSQYLDKSPQSASPQAKIAAMKESNSYFPPVSAIKKNQNTTSESDSAKVTFDLEGDAGDTDSEPAAAADQELEKDEDDLKNQKLLKEKDDSGNTSGNDKLNTEGEREDL